MHISVVGTIVGIFAYYDPNETRILVAIPKILDILDNCEDIDRDSDSYLYDMKATIYEIKEEDYDIIELNVSNILAGFYRLNLKLMITFMEDMIEIFPI